MSLGWQCESALLPSKAKPINVDGKSMMGLLAVVYDQEKKFSKVSVNQSNRPGSRKSIKKQSAESGDLFAKKIKVDESRTASIRTSDKTDKESRVEISLKAKADIYDKLKEGVAIDGSQAFLVSFDNNPIVCAKDVISETIKKDRITGQKRMEVGILPNEISKRAKTAFHDNYEWSNGEAVSFEPLLEDNRRMQDFVEGCIESEVKMSQHARVRSQWEKTLKGDVKTYLEEVHAATEKDRLENTDGNDSKRSSKDDRRELLRLKRLQHGIITDETSIE